MAGYKLPAHTTQVERPKFFSPCNNDRFLARTFLHSLRALCMLQMAHINCDHTQHQHDEQTIAL